MKKRSLEEPQPTLGLLVSGLAEDVPTSEAVNHVNAYLAGGPKPKDAIWRRLEEMSMSFESIPRGAAAVLRALHEEQGTLPRTYMSAVFIVCFERLESSEQDRLSCIAGALRVVQPNQKLLDAVAHYARETHLPLIGEYVRQVVVLGRVTGSFTNGIAAHPYGLVWPSGNIHAITQNLHYRYNDKSVFLDLCQTLISQLCGDIGAAGVRASTFTSLLTMQYRYIRFGHDNDGFPEVRCGMSCCHF